MSGVKRRAILGLKFGPPVVIAWVVVASLLFVACFRVLRVYPALRGRFWGSLLVSVATALLFRVRPLVGCTLEVDDDWLRIRPYGYLWFAKRIPLSAVVSVAPWGEDEPRNDGQWGERAPRLIINLTEQGYVLVGPWNTPNADMDYAQVRQLFGALFIGDGQLRR